LDVKKEFTASVKNTMEELVTSKINFAPIEILSSVVVLDINIVLILFRYIAEKN